MVAEGTTITASKPAGMKETVCSTVTHTEEAETFVAMLLGIILAHEKSCARMEAVQSADFET